MTSTQPMYEISEEEQRRLEKLLRKHRKKLLAYPNVHNVDVGFEFSNGEPTGRLAIRVHVTEKLAKSSLKKKEQLPDELDGVPVDVIQFNPRPQLDRNQRHEPLVGGVQIMNVNKPGAGTIGMIVFDRINLEPRGLSNYHVMVRTPPVAGDGISQPGANIPADVLGTVTASNKTLDCAVCRLGARQWSLEIYGVGPATGTASARLGMKVLKSGLSSGVTWGIIDGIEPTAFTVIRDTSVPSIGEMSLPGDSGSVWMELATNKVVGLHYAGEAATDPNERAKAMQIHAVLNALNVLVLADAAIGAAFIGSHCRVLAKTRSLAPCKLQVVYPSGRRSSARGLGPKVADGNGWVEWSWMIGTHTKRVGAGTGAPLGRPLAATVTLDGVDHQLFQFLEGTTHTD
jgi:hypothetical protein